MTLDPRSCYRALASHDRRFDGRFFVGVRTTRVYCRPVCTVRTPRAENCSYYVSPAAAEQAGYRPCLRCRPELAPGNAAIDSGERLAQAAADLIDNGVFDQGGVEALAGTLGISSRHLRRIFMSTFGVSPLAYAQTHRLLLAKRLLTDTALPVTDIAFAVGFQSVRRFNAAFGERYRLAPKRMRRDAARESGPAPLVFDVAYRPPYHWDGMLDFLARRAIPGIEQVEGERYLRTLHVRIRERAYLGWITVADRPQRSSLSVELSPGLAGAIPAVLGRVRRAFDTACDPLAVDAALGSLASGTPGLRVPGTVDGFELAVRAIVGQQISVSGARTLLGRMVAALGPTLPATHGALERLFPTPDVIAGAGAAPIASLGVLPARARTVVALATAVQRGDVTVDDAADVNDAIARLRAVPGIGPWTAEMIAMRALSWPDAFPASDGALLRALHVKTAAEATSAGEPWRPWRSYAVMHLWRNA